jgi:predicted nucleotidyltransferase
MKVRLESDEIRVIRKVVSEFDKDAEIYIFGSRVDMGKKGGDIDILVLSDRIDWRARREIRVSLIEKLGDRKIDLIVARKDEKDNPLVELAIEEGVRI